MKKMYTVKESDVRNTVDDFIEFCRIIEEQNPKLTNTNSLLGKKILFELNARLNYSEDVKAPNYQQRSYPVIDLMFHIVIAEKLYLKTADMKGNVYLTPTKRKDEFVDLNCFEQFTFLLEAFWSRYDLNEYIKVDIRNNSIDSLVQAMASSPHATPLKKEAFLYPQYYEIIRSFHSTLVQYFNYFGFCTYTPVEWGNKRPEWHEESIKTVIPTELGVNICKILTKEKILYWNLPFMKDIDIQQEEFVPGVPSLFIFKLYSGFGDAKAEKMYNERIKSGYIPLYKYLAPVFPKNGMNNTVTAKLDMFIKGCYTFQVSLSNKVWRKINFSYNHTLHDVHLAIQEAFEFDNDHLYSFFMDAKLYSKNAYHSPIVEEEPCADGVLIGDLELHIGQKILYLFDYGDTWLFDVQLLSIDKDKQLPESPEMVEAKGEAPQQYFFDDEDFDDII